MGKAPHPCTHRQHSSHFNLICFYGYGLGHILLICRTFCVHNDLYVFIWGWQSWFCLSNEEPTRKHTFYSANVVSILYCELKCYTTKGLKVNHCLLIHQWWTPVRRFIGPTKPSLEYTKPKLTNCSGPPHKRWWFLNFHKGQHSRAFQHNCQSCQLRTLAQWMVHKNRTYHQANPAWRALATGNWLSITLSKLERPFRSCNNAVLFETKIVHRLV